MTSAADAPSAGSPGSPGFSGARGAPGAPTGGAPERDGETPSPGPTPERVWLCYLACVGVVACVAPGGGMAQHDPGMFLLVHVPVLGLVLFSRWLAVSRSAAAARWLRAALAIVGLPVVFSALCWLLPAVHPEPYEYLWLDVDRWLFGCDLGRLADGLPPWAIELLQLDYALFYVLCVGAALLCLWCSGARAFDRAVLLLVVGFLSSYLGYLLVPTIAPKLVLEFEQDLAGLWLTAPVRDSIDAAEANHWDCFPSGHTMMTLVSLVMLFRWARCWFWLLLVPGVLLVASTVLLRYHWGSDVLAGALLALPSVWLSDWLARRDGWPPVGATAARSTRRPETGSADRPSAGAPDSR